MFTIIGGICMSQKSKRVSLVLLVAIIVTSIPAAAIIGAKKANVSSVKITNVSKRVSLQKGKTFRLKTAVKVSPNKGKYRKVKFVSSNEKVVVVNGRGVIKGLKKGTAKVTAVSQSNPKKKASIRIRVTTDILVRTIVLNRSTIQVDEDYEDDIQLEVTKILPANAKNKEVEWASSDEDVAEVDEDGLVTTYDEGEAVITATAADGGGSLAICKVTVTPGTEEDDSEDDDSGLDDQDVDEDTE